MAGHGFKSTVAGALMGVAAIFAPLAATAQETIVPTAIPSAPESYAAATHDEAKAASTGQIILHIGEGFPINAALGVKSALNTIGYPQVEIMVGGEPSELTLCLDGKCLNKNFPFGEESFVISIVEEFGSHLKNRETAQLSM